MAAASKAPPGWMLPALLSLLMHGGLAVGAHFLPPPLSNRDAPIEIVQRELPKKEEPKKEEPKKEEPKKEEPKKEEPKQEEPKKVVRPKKAPKKAPPPDPEPQGKPESKTPPAPDTGAKTFGIDMKGTTTAAPGTGVAVPEGQTVRQDPRVRRVGKGRPKAKPGFKKDYKRGERAPLAVVTTRPQKLKDVQPRYPEHIRDLEIEGRVVLKLTVNGEGKVIKAKVLKGLHKDLDAEAIKAAMKLRFAPGKVGGTPITMDITYTFTFVLD